MSKKDIFIPFNKACFTGKEKKYLEDVLNRREFSGNGYYTKKCEAWLEEKLQVKKAILTPSATAALEMMALIIGIKPQNEVIMPSFTFVSTANAFALRGARIAFVDIRPDTLNIDENLVEEAINEKTKAIVPVHYAGVGCEMEKIKAIASKYNLFVLEDAAQGMMATYSGKFLGTLGHLGAFSFHETKNYTCGEGGALLINDENLIEKAEIVRDKGTNRRNFLRGEVDRYSWVDLGGSYVVSELQSAYLYGQLKAEEEIRKDRIYAWEYYYNHLKPLEEAGYIRIPSVPENCLHNGHIFYIRVEKETVRDKLLSFLRSKGIYAVFHYVPLHSSIGGRKYGYFVGEDRYTTLLSNTLLRLPIYYGIGEEKLEYVVEKISEFFRE